MNGSEGVAREIVRMWVLHDPQGRAVGINVHGPGAAVHDMLSRSTTEATLEISDGMFSAWANDKTADRYEFGGYTLQRLPLATPEMVDVIEAAQALDRAATTEHLRPEDLAKRYRDLHVALRSLDAARAGEVANG